MILNCGLDLVPSQLFFFSLALALLQVSSHSATRSPRNAPDKLAMDDPNYYIPFIERNRIKYEILEWAKITNLVCQQNDSTKYLSSRSYGF